MNRDVVRTNQTILQTKNEAVGQVDRQAELGRQKGTQSTKWIHMHQGRERADGEVVGGLVNGRVVWTCERDTGASRATHNAQASKCGCFCTGWHVPPMCRALRFRTSKFLALVLLACDCMKAAMAVFLSTLFLGLPSVASSKSCPGHVSCSWWAVRMYGKNTCMANRRGHTGKFDTDTREPPTTATCGMQTHPQDTGTRKPPEMATAACIVHGQDRWSYVADVVVQVGVGMKGERGAW